MPSSTRAELFALFSALIVCLPYSSPIIFLNSQAVIDAFNNFINKESLTIRSREKISNYTVLILIHHVINDLHLIVKLNKIKGHLGDSYNDKADTLAKVKRSKLSLSLNFTVYDDLHLLLSFKSV